MDFYRRPLTRSCFIGVCTAAVIGFAVVAEGQIASPLSTSRSTVISAPPFDDRDREPTTATSQTGQQWSSHRPVGFTSYGRRTAMRGQTGHPEMMTGVRTLGEQPAEVLPDSAIIEETVAGRSNARRRRRDDGRHDDGRRRRDAEAVVPHRAMTLAAARHTAACRVPALRGKPWRSSRGAHGFTGPANRGETGSFGFHVGFNWGTPIHFLFRRGLRLQIRLSGRIQQL